MEYTENYHLNKPSLSDQYNIIHWNDNTDKIDMELKSQANKDVELNTRITTEMNKFTFGNSTYAVK